MADQESVTPEQFFVELLPAGFQAQRDAGGAVPQDFTMQYVLTGDGGGEWAVTIKDGQLSTNRGRHDAIITFTLSADDFGDAILGRNGATIAILLPQNRPGRPDNTGRVKQMKGTVAQELARDGMDPFKIEMCFNGGEAPRTVLKMKLVDFVAMQEGRLNGQEAFMTGRLRIEGDMAFMMQIAALTA
ncbi:MAG TPA: SCP2 sterol-binding domain-containing protein [Candidatus Eisenbacteria bacterium]|nr:SCP2 sterol-binding domain-containing protein [Candidatus Eisenbacteria bacterium]